MTDEDKSTSPSTPPPATADLLTARETAAYLGVSERTLESWRASGAGPVYIKLRWRIRYRRKALDAWLEANERTRVRDDVNRGDRGDKQ